jgi:hypothetical protein
VDIGHEAVFTTPGAQKYLRRTSSMLRVVGRLAQVGLLRLLRIRGLPLPPTALPFSPAQRAALDSRFPAAHSFFAGADEFLSMTRIGAAMAGLSEPGSLGQIPVAVISHGVPVEEPELVIDVIARVIRSVRSGRPLADSAQIAQ